MVFQILILVDMSIIKKRRDEVMKQRKQAVILASQAPIATFSDDCLVMLYQPDEHNMVDCSLSIVMSGHVRPELTEYAKNSLLKPITENRFESPDDALDSILPMEFQYGNERDFLSNMVLNQFKDYIKAMKKVE